jgi:ribonucleoside-diphosphate reductase alpha chain
VYTHEEVYEKTLEYFGGDTLAANVFFKYVLRDKEGNYLESDPDQMHRRLAKEFARIESKYPNPMDEEYIYSFLKNFEYIVPQGSPMAGIGNSFDKTSLSNCIVVTSPDDSISGIMNTGRDAANLFKRRAGVGIDLSTLRPEGTPVSNAAKTTTGAWSFADLYSYICTMVGQNGRRGALMISMDVHHPDIMKFVRMKDDLTRVTGANISVKLTDDFMKAVEEDKEYLQYWPLDKDVELQTREPTREEVTYLELSNSHKNFERYFQSPKHITQIRPARKVWDAIIESAHRTGEPGLQFWDNITENLPAHCYPEFKTIATNPCGELPLSAYDSCRLISINLKHFIKDPFTWDSTEPIGSNFDWEKYSEVIRVAQRLSDDLVDLELEKIDNILSIVKTDDEQEMWTKMRKSCSDGRRTGLGTHGLADSLARMCLIYDSDEAIKHTGEMYKRLRDTAYWESIKLAQERGAFPVFDWELEKDNAFIKRLPQELQEAIEQHGRRNISLLTNAPTGSVSILSQCSSGIEPVYKFTYTRRRKRSHDEQVLDSDHVDETGSYYVEYSVGHHNLEEWRNEHADSKEDSLPDYFVTSKDINWERRVEIQSTIQQYIDHSISSTINLPEDIDRSTVADLYLLGWKSGLKGLTIYREGSRSGVLVDKKGKEGKFNYRDYYPRDKCLKCDIHTVAVKGERWTILVGLVDDKPYEVFGGLADCIEIPDRYKKGEIRKRVLKSGKNVYDLHLEDGFKFKNIVKLFDNQLYQVHTRMISLTLRHGTKPSFLVEQLLKDPDNDLTSFSKVVARVLKRYIADGTKVFSDKRCPQCKAEGLVYQDGCKFCMTCTWSACD